MESFVSEFCEQYKIERWKLFTKTTDRDIILKRQILIYKLFQSGELKYHIAKYFSGVITNATVHYSINRIAGLIHIKDKHLLNFINKYERKSIASCVL